MTRQRHNRPDWETFSPAKRKRMMVAQKALMMGSQSLTAEERKLLDQPAVRAAPVQRESQHARMFAARAYRHWWYPGLTRIEHRSANWREGDGRRVEGAQTGMPDYWLFVPERGIYVESIDDHDLMMPRRAVCELKAPEHKPKRAREAWWLEPWPEGQKTWHALRYDQWRWLQMLAAQDFATCVAYGHDECEAFFVEVAGEKPDVMPDWWPLPFQDEFE